MNSTPNRNTDPLTPAQRAAFDHAAARSAEKAATGCRILIRSAGSRVAASVRSASTGETLADLGKFANERAARSAAERWVAENA